ncbi:calcineurin-like phosphoesterase [Xylariaceae sp. FL0804]|nr:calcineurin-like phosphoesterase [Xylariaceae sp. FL0804]
MSASPATGPRPRTRRTRFVCISDTHNCTVKLPRGDVLVHCGDLTNQGGRAELSKQVRWLESAADFECRLVVAGNHDLALDAAWYAQYGAYHAHGASGAGAGAGASPQAVSADCLALLRRPSSPLTYLAHEARRVRLRRPGGPRTAFTVFGSPYTPAASAAGNWAFQYGGDGDGDGGATNDASGVGGGGRRADELWSEIPLDADVVITHGPPRGHLDERGDRRGAAGCEALRRALWRVRPRLALCGHVHDGRGAERVRWELGDRNVRYREAGDVWQWEDPGAGNLKNSLVDLTAKGGMPLDNDGGRAPRGAPLPSGPEVRTSDLTAGLGIGTRGLGGDPASGRSDVAALVGRLGRRETCIVNCAIMAGNYPHRGHGPRRTNKPIVIDLDLPVCEDEDEDEDA